MIAYCPTCREQAIMNDRGVCSWCGTQTSIDTTDHSKPRRGKPRGSAWLTEKQIREAHAAHVAGESLNSIGKRLLPTTRYRSLYGVVNALSTEWKRRGWFVRDRIDAVRKTCTIHGRAPRDHRLRDPEYKRELRRKQGLLLDRPYCSATTIHGKPCRSRARRDSPLCHSHANPARARADLARGRARFQASHPRTWIEKGVEAQRLHDAGASWQLVADQLGYSSRASACTMAHRATRIAALEEAA